VIVQSKNCVRSPGLSFTCGVVFCVFLIDEDILISDKIADWNIASSASSASSFGVTPVDFTNGQDRLACSADMSANILLYPLCGPELGVGVCGSILIARLEEGRGLRIVGFESFRLTDSDLELCTESSRIKSESVDSIRGRAGRGADSLSDSETSKDRALSGGPIV
jgi:hypothetical protein